LNLLNHYDGINFKLRLDEKIKQDRVQNKRGGKSSLLLISVILAVLFFSGEAFLLYRLWYVIEPELKAVKGYTSNISVIEDYKASTDFKDKNTEIRSKISGITSSRETISSYPEFSKKLYNGIKDCADKITLKSLSYSREEGTLKIYAVSSDIAFIPDFVSRLKDTDLFYFVNYYGAQQQGSSLGSDSYMFNVDCIMKEEGALDAQAVES